MENVMTKQIYLASRSPRRRELLRQIGVRFELLVFRDDNARGEDPDVDETPFPGEDVERYVERMALSKAEAGFRRQRWRHLPPLPVLAADTTLELEGEIIGKPESAEHARQILQRLSGCEHRVLTAVSVSNGERTRSDVSISTVRFREMTDSEIRNYVSSGESLDKAGAYAIQGLGAIFIEEIHGSYSGIMGLPLFETARMLESFGLSVLRQS